MDKLHLSILGAWILVIIHDRLIAMTGIDLIALPFAGLAVMVYGLYSYNQKDNESTKGKS